MRYPVHRPSLPLPCQGPRLLLHLLGGSLVAVLLLLGGSSCTSARVTPPRATPSPPATPTVVGLAPAPTDCPWMPPSQTLTMTNFGANPTVHLLGSAPVWFVAGSFPTTIHPPANVWKVIVDVGPNYPQPVTLQIRALRTGALVWWVTDRTSTQTLVLDPAADPNAPLAASPHEDPAVGWHEWGTFPRFEAAGCYRMETSWRGGHWSSVFAVGG